MHNAPAVSYPVGRSFFQAGLLLGLALLSAGLGGYWIAHSGRFGAPQLLIVLLWLTAAVVAGGAWRRPARGELQWDGQAWAWHSGATAAWPGQVAVRLDWQRGLLLAFAGESGRTQWLWLARSADATRWPAVRRALYAAPGRATPALDAGGLAS